MIYLNCLVFIACVAVLRKAQLETIKQERYLKIVNETVAIRKGRRGRR